jgi:hypothetical protein
MIQCCYNMVTNSIIVSILYYIHVVYILKGLLLIFFQHHICITHALLNVRDVMLQQHSCKLDIQYWLNVLFLLLMLLIYVIMTLSQHCICVVEGRWCNVDVIIFPYTYEMTTMPKGLGLFDHQKGCVVRGSFCWPFLFFVIFCYFLLLFYYL